MLMRSRLLFVALAIVALMVGFDQPVASQSFSANGLSYVRSAWNLPPGYLVMYANTRFFGKVGKINLAQGAPSAVTFWDVQGTLNFNYGISEHFEIGFHPIIYQDTQRGGRGFNLIDDIFASLSIASFGQTGSSFTYGVDLAARFPSAKKHNIIFEPYSAGKVSFGGKAKLSYARDPLYPGDGFSMHFNFGYWNHNDVGEQLTDIPETADTVRVEQPTQELLYGFGVNLPTEKFDFSFEISGNAFIQKPPETAYSRENYLYLTQRVRYKSYRWLSLDMGFDIRLAGSNDKTNYALRGVNRVPDMPNYADWRVILGTRVIILPTSVYSLSERDILMKKAETRRELFEKIIREQRETESAEEELERIKEERRKAERELERLRRILEGEAKRKQQQQDQNQQQDPPQHP